MRVIAITKEQVQEMLERAATVADNSYPDAGAYAVTVLTKGGNIYEGVSYKSDTYTLTMHAEATALAHAAIHGEKDIIAITGPNCHACKQLLWEHALRSNIDIQVVMENDDSIRLVPISQQMPYPWPDPQGNH